MKLPNKYIMLSLHHDLYSSPGQVIFLMGEAPSGSEKVSPTNGLKLSKLGTSEKLNSLRDALEQHKWEKREVKLTESIDYYTPQEITHQNPKPSGTLRYRDEFEYRQNDYYPNVGMIRGDKIPSLPEGKGSYVAFHKDVIRSSKNLQQ